MIVRWSAEETAAVALRKPPVNFVLSGNVFFRNFDRFLSVYRVSYHFRYVVTHPPSLYSGTARPTDGVAYADIT